MNNADSSRSFSNERSAIDETTSTRIPWRAALGAALITVAAGGVFVAYRTAQDPPTTRYLVATEDIAAGSTIDSSSLGAVAIDLPSSVAAIPATESGLVEGQVAAVNVSELELLSPEQVLEEGRMPTPGSLEVTISLDPTRVPVDALREGNLVSLLATDPATEGTRVLAEDVRLLSIGSGEGGAIGSGSGIPVRFSVADSSVARSLVDASVREEVTVAIPAPTSKGDLP